MDNIISYFNGEKLQCTIGAIISVALIGVSIYFLFVQRPFLKGLAYTVIPLSIFLLIICVGVVLRTSNDISRVSTFQNKDTESIQKVEIPRMEKVMKSFSIIKKVELVLLGLGLIMTIFFWQIEVVRGIAIGLVIMGASLYLFDHLAEARGEIYLAFLKSL
jgi:hypothetical protein